MAKTKEKFVMVRIKETTHTRIKVKAARDKKKIWEKVEEMSKNECI